jgi:hypothetical protein
MKYTITWSYEDECWICEHDEGHGLKGHGHTAMEALCNSMEHTIAVLTMRLDDARREDDPTAGR